MHAGDIGGCPSVPYSTGNVATESLAYLLHSVGLDVSIDIKMLKKVSSYVKRFKEPGIS